MLILIFNKFCIHSRLIFEIKNMSLLIFKIFKSQNKTTYNTFKEVSVSLDVLLHKTLLVSAEINTNQSNVLGKEIVDIYRNNKTKIHHIAYHLGDSYILPYDREDILEIINSINEISKLLVTFTKKRNYYIRNFESDFYLSPLVEVIIDAVKVVSDSLLKLQKFKHNNKVFLISIEKLKQTNSDFEAIFENLTQELFEKENIPRDLVMKQDLLDTLEKINLKASNHIHSLESIMVKYS